MQELSALQVRKFTTLFQHYDRNHNAFLELRDFMTFADAVARIFGWHDKDEHLAAKKISVLKQNRQELFFRLAKVADTNQDGKISLPEYLEYFRRHALECKNMGTASPWIKQSCQQMMLLYDCDGSNTIGLAEYQKMLQAIGSDADAAAAFARMDQDGDGRLNLFDLERLALEFVISDDPEAAGNLLYCGKI